MAQKTRVRDPDHRRPVSPVSVLRCTHLSKAQDSPNSRVGHEKYSRCRVPTGARHTRTGYHSSPVLTLRHDI